MKSGLFLLKLRPQYHVLKPQLYYSNLIIPPQKNICYTCQHLSDHIILKTNMVAAESTSHPLLNTSCVGATHPQQLSGSLSEQFDVTARSPTTTTQPDRSNIDLPIIPWGLGASQCLYVEVCGRVARSSGDIYTTQTSSHLCPTVSAQLWMRWLKSAIYCFTSWVNSIRKTLECGTFCCDLFFADVWQIKGGRKKKSQMCHCKVPGHRAPPEQLQCSSASLHQVSGTSLDGWTPPKYWVPKSKISHSCSGVFRLQWNTIHIISICFFNCWVTFSAQRQTFSHKRISSAFLEIEDFMF